MRIILLDARANFRDDVRTRLLVDDERNVEMLTDLADSSGLGTAISTFKPDLVVVADNVYPEQSNWAGCGAAVVGYITRTGNPDIFTQDGIPSYPAISGATHLLNLLETGVPAIKMPSPAFNSSQVQQPVPQISFNPPADDEVKPIDMFKSANKSGQQMPSYTPMGQKGQVNTSRRPGAFLYYHEQEHPPTPAPASAPLPPSPQPAQTATMYPPSQTAEPQYPAHQLPTTQPAPAYSPVYEQSQQQHQVAQSQPTPFQQVQQNPNSMGTQPMSQAPQQPPMSYPGHPMAPSYGQQMPNTAPAYLTDYPGRNYGAPVKETLDESRHLRNDAATANAVLSDIAAKNTPTKTVAVYAAKGGVGKTTISSELAVILSMTSRGRGNMRVCLVDYNIDFGDVLTTLNLDNRGPNMSHWAADVRKRIASGEDPDKVQYTRQEIEGRLQRVGTSSLYVLVAPIAHEDSMDIRSEEPGIILRNIIQNGCFDFVICDTGNNTRDATVSALDAADTILMVVTQDVSAVNCNKSFLQTMAHVGFDIDKIRLVVNGVMPNKFTQVSVQEVEEMFPYPCIARFKRDPDVTKANNCSEPIVRQPNHEFTKEMRQIVAYLTGQQIEKPAKKGIFSRFKKG